MRNDHVKQAPPVPLIRLKNLLWIPILAGAFALPEIYGTPHLRASYTYRGAHSTPFYLRCDYWGLHPFTLRPADGACPLFLFVRTGS